MVFARVIRSWSISIVSSVGRGVCVTLPGADAVLDLGLEEKNQWKWEITGNIIIILLERPSLDLSYKVWVSGSLCKTTISGINKSHLCVRSKLKNHSHTLNAICSHTQPFDVPLGNQNIATIQRCQKALLITFLGLHLQTPPINRHLLIAHI